MEINVIIALFIGVLVGVTIAFGYVIIHSMRIADEKAKIDEEMSTMLAEMFKEKPKVKRKKIETKDTSIEAIKLSKD
jgi:MFS superfamily sulfate permease-like transporter